MKNMTTILNIMCLLLLAAASLYAAEVKNLVSGQNGDRGFVQYDLVGKLGEKEADVIVFLEIGGERYSAERLSLSGDYGKNVKVGKGKRFFWDFLKDYPAGFEGEVTWDVESTGSTNININDFRTTVAGNDDIKKMIKTSFPKLDFRNVSKSIIDGLYEIEKDDSKMYFYPGKKYLIVGDIYDRDRNNISKDKNKYVKYYNTGKNINTYSALEAIKKYYPTLKIDEVSNSEIPILYEIISGSNILYYYNDKELLVAGEIYAPNGDNITQLKKNKLQEKLSKDIDLSKAIKIGSGQNKIIEFTDPDCPYCRKAEAFLLNRNDVTRYIFFSPFAHPKAASKIHYILGATDYESAFHDMMSGKEIPSNAGSPTQNIQDLAAKHLEIARSAGIQGTPTFIINGQMVIGADIKKIEGLLR